MWLLANSAFLLMTKSELYEKLWFIEWSTDENWKWTCVCLRICCIWEISVTATMQQIFFGRRQWNLVDGMCSIWSQVQSIAPEIHRKSIKRLWTSATTFTYFKSHVHHIIMFISVLNLPCSRIHNYKTHFSTFPM